jgi:hypothetical protein
MKYLPIINILLVIILAVVCGFLFFRLTNITQVLERERKMSNGEKVVYVDAKSGEENNLTEFKRYVDGAIASVAAKLNVKPTSGPQASAIAMNTPNPTSVAQNKNVTSYIPMGTSFASFSTSWIDMPDSTVTFDLENDYSKNASATWSVSLKVQHANGQAFARIWDDTNKIAVSGSELSTQNNSEFVKVTSGNLAIWRGRNTYKVQIKSLNGFEVTASSASVKVVE